MSTLIHSFHDNSNTTFKLHTMKCTSHKETPKTNLRARSPSPPSPPTVPRHQLHLYAEASSESKDSASNTTHTIHVHVIVGSTHTIAKRLNM